MPLQTKIVNIPLHASTAKQMQQLEADLYRTTINKKQQKTPKSIPEIPRHKYC